MLPEPPFRLAARRAVGRRVYEVAVDGRPPRSYPDTREGRRDLAQDVRILLGEWLARHNRTEATEADVERARQKADAVAEAVGRAAAPVRHAS